jgi:hypothetical protein
VSHLLGALPALARVSRYGNVRQADARMVAKVVDGLVARASAGLAPACASLNADAAAGMAEAVTGAHQAIYLLREEEHLRLWNEALGKLADRDNLHGLIAGRAVRLLMDAGLLDAAEAARRLGLALSMAGDPARGAAWIEGLLKDGGATLVHDDELWGVLDGWVAGLRPEAFLEVLPLLRRTFSTFGEGERRQLGQKAKKAGQGPGASAGRSDADIDPSRARLALGPVLAILGGKTA